MQRFKYDPVTHVITNEPAAEPEAFPETPERGRLDPKPDAQQAPAGTPPNGDFPDLEPSAESFVAPPKRSSDPKNKNGADARQSQQRKAQRGAKKTQRAEEAGDEKSTSQPISAVRETKRFSR
jgi:hypothetical protein